MLFNAHFVAPFSVSVVTFEAENEDEAFELAEEYAEENELEYRYLEVEELEDA